MKRVSWWQRFREWSVPSQNAAPEILVARSELSSSQREIADELEGAFTSYQERLEDLAARLSVLDDQGIQAEGESIREAQQSLRRAIRRVAVSERTTPELTNEWQDWSRYAFQGPLAKALVDERREMLRSELVLRGVRLEKEERGIEVGQAYPELPASVPLLIKFSDLQPVTDRVSEDFSEWDEMIAPAITNEVDHWEKTFADYPLEFGEPSHLASLLQRRKDAHARLISLERLS